MHLYCENRDMTLAYMKTVFRDDGAGYMTFQSFPAGSSKVEPGVTPAQDMFVQYTLDEVRDRCGQSRLDGGMHFTAAVSDSFKLCSGFGSNVEDYILDLLDGSTDLLTEYDPTASSGGSP